MTEEKRGERERRGISQNKTTGITAEIGDCAEK